MRNHFVRAAASSTSDPGVHDFTKGSIPSGWAINSSAKPTGSKFTDSTDGNYYLIKGDCNDELAWPLRYTTAFQGDNLFQLSFYASDVNCRDWSMVVSEHSYTSTTAADWYWNWSGSGDSNTLNAKCNCATPTLYGFSSSVETGGSVGQEKSAQWYTMHFMVYTSIASTKMKVTEGQEDWDASGTQVGNLASISNRIVSNTTTNYYFGIGADNDETTYAKASACRFSSDSDEFL